MNWAALDIYGIVVMCGTSPRIDEHTIFPPADRIITGSPDGIVPERFYVDGDTFKPIPEKPDSSYVLDRQTKQWEQDMTLAAAQARSKRDQFLSSSDWTQTADQSDSTKQKWQPYRQALRDVPEQEGFPTNIIWPEKP